MCNAPLYEALKSLAKRQPIRFSMPGHGGQSPLDTPVLFAASLDFTELQETGNLYAEDTIIAAAEALWAQKMGAENALFLTGGSSQGVRSALLLLNLAGKKVLFGRDTHQSVDTALALLDITPLYLQKVTAETVQATLTNHQDIAALFVTSPSYYGVDLDIKALASLCKKEGIPLIVDEAHGAHYAFLTAKPQAVASGATVAVTSLHKTLPAMGQSALMTLSAGLPPAAARRANMAFGTSSPSYIMLAQADLLRAALERDGCPNLDAVHALRQALIPLGLADNDDPYRLHIMTAPFGYSGYEARGFLHKNGILIELADKNSIVCILSFYHTASDFETFLKALKSLYGNNRPPLRVQETELPTLPARILSPRSAFLAKKEQRPLKSCTGCIAGQSLALFPPGTALVAPGELLTKESIDALLTFFPPDEPLLVCVK